MPAGRPRLDIRRSPYLATAALALALEARFRARFDWRTGKNRPLSRRAAMRLAALAASGTPIEPRTTSATALRADGRGGLYEVVKRYTHAAPGRMEELAAPECL